MYNKRPYINRKNGENKNVKMHLLKYRYIKLKKIKHEKSNEIKQKHIGNIGEIHLMHQNLIFLSVSV